MSRAGPIVHIVDDDAAVRDSLSLLLELKGVARGKESRTLASALLERVNLAYAAKRKVKEYSGGMRQRLGIAQAIAGDPRLIIVDEPTAGLDPEERHRFYRLLAELAERRTVLLSTHILQEVEAMCNRVVFINEGRVVYDGTPAGLGSDPAALDAKFHELTGVVESA